MKMPLSIRNDELPKNLKYLIMIFQKGRKLMEYQPVLYPRFIGFSGGRHGAIIGQFHTGLNKKNPTIGRIVQLPQIFNTKKEAIEVIKVHKKSDKGLYEEHIYNIVPIDIGNGVLTKEQQKTSKRIIRRIYFTLDDKKIQKYNKTQLITTCGRLKTEISWLIDALMINL